MPLINEPTTTPATTTTPSDQTTDVHTQEDGHPDTMLNGGGEARSSGHKGGKQTKSDNKHITSEQTTTTTKVVSKPSTLNGASPLLLSTDVQIIPSAPTTTTPTLHHHNNNSTELNRINAAASRNGHAPSSPSHHTSHLNGDGHNNSPDLYEHVEQQTNGATVKPLTDVDTPEVSPPAAVPNHAQTQTFTPNGTAEQRSETHAQDNPQIKDSPSHARRHFRCSRELELSIPLYYAGKHIFITGATGFIGKVFIEKLLRSCPDIAGIHCLIRPKNKQTVDQRLAELIESKLFDNLRRDHPSFDSKLHPVEGDILLPELGISPEDLKTLEDHVNIVFHSAATVRFDEPLRKAVEMNVIAVRKMLNLSRKFQHLEAFVHVSTAYANCDISYIEEKVYPPPVEPQKIIDVLSWMDDEMVDLFTPKLIGEKPNTYTYTKQLAEHLLVTEGADLPLAIVRPSIVGAAWREPFPGWIDNLNGPSGMYIAAGKGILRWMKADTNAVADIVPVDIPVNIMIAVGWYTAVAKPKTIHIYHATTGSTNPFRWGEMEVAVNKTFKQIPLEKCFRRPKVNLVNNTFVTDYWKFVSHLCPAYVCDMAFALVGRKPRMVKLYNKLHHSIDVLQFFTCNEWQWESTNLEILRHQLTPEDLRMFYFDIRPLHWPTYIENYCLGAKKYVLNEDLSGLPAARAHIRKLRIIRTIFNSAICVILWRVLIAKSQFARNLWFFIVSLVFKFVRFFRITSTMHK